MTDIIESHLQISRLHGTRTTHRCKEGKFAFSFRLKLIYLFSLKTWFIRLLFSSIGKF
jgi:hypothetical protein